MEQICFQMKYSLDITVVLGSDYNHFYTNMCTQSSKTAYFLCPEKENAE